MNLRRREEAVNIPSSQVVVMYSFQLTSQLQSPLRLGRCPRPTLKATHLQIQPLTLIASQVRKVDPVPAPSLNGIQT